MMAVAISWKGGLNLGICFCSFYTSFYFRLLHPKRQHRLFAPKHCVLHRHCSPLQEKAMLAVLGNSGANLLDQWPRFFKHHLEVHRSQKLLNLTCKALSLK
ncbi:hypothetical protein DM01DRAFT_6308 [Hesseltinella vesiculosa]|uniref:Uncharacterized protein n=1 Tax=Hesseltinella vesiculosa TaxID=101127 RepID=A0A1X2GSZ9_9FUNG|nr:hypothetical protein DM01DRAFT_6308 [Hesseltinella vesiculosa]